jgi:hypothetical protein
LPETRFRLSTINSLVSSRHVLPISPVDFLGVLSIALVVPGTGQTQSDRGEEKFIRELIQAFADARNSKNGAAVADFYSDDGEWIQGISES